MIVWVKLISITRIQNLLRNFVQLSLHYSRLFYYSEIFYRIFMKNDHFSLNLVFINISVLQMNPQLIVVNIFTKKLQYSNCDVLV